MPGTSGGLFLLFGLGIISGAFYTAAMIAERWYTRLLPTLICVAALLTGVRLIVDWFSVSGGG